MAERDARSIHDQLCLKPAITLSRKNSTKVHPTNERRITLCQIAGSLKKSVLRELIEWFGMMIWLELR
jgi:hypothetical protein